MKKSDQHIELITKYLSGEISVEEKKLFLNWLKSSPENPALFQNYKTIWYISDNEEATSQTKNAYARFISNQKQANVSKQIRQKSQINWALAATVLLLLGFTSTYFLFLQPGMVSTSYVTTYIPSGEKGEVNLPDGTIIWLNAETTLKYPSNFSAEYRKVILSGEAFFDVKKDPRHPFLVETDKLTIRVLGTRFNLKCYEDDDQIETTLIEGSVNILGKQQLKLGEDIYLKPNEQAIFYRKKQELTINSIPIETPENQSNKTQEAIPSQTLSTEANLPPTIQTIASWKDNKLIFDNDPFPELIQKLERWYGVEIKILDNSLKNNVYSGKFVYNESIDQVLNVISHTTPITYEIKRNVVTINTKHN